MNTAQSLTASFEWSKKMKKAGWPQRDYFAWYVYPDVPESDREPGVERPRNSVERHYENGWKTQLEHYSAPTVEEIMRSLPPVFESKALFSKTLGDLGWMVCYGGTRPFSHWFGDPDSLANAAAAMWCYLAENKLLPKKQ